MNSLPENLPDDPVLLKQMLGQMLDERQLDKGKIVRLEEQNALLLQRLFGRKSEQTADAATPQLALFNEVESVVEPVDETSDEEGVAPTKRRGKGKPLPADLPRTEIISKLWVYIKANNLQDAANKRNINADAKLKELFGKPQVSMFELAGPIGKHVT